MSQNVLVIDDDKVCNFLTVNSLKKAGVEGEINVKLNGKEGIEHLENTSEFPSLILLDINMPVMNGMEFLEEYSKKGFDGKSKIAMYTSSIQKSDEDFAYQFSDVIEFIHKPITKESLEQLISKLETA